MLNFLNSALKIFLKYIIDDIEISSDSDEENSDKKNLKNTHLVMLAVRKLFYACNKNFFSCI